MQSDDINELATAGGIRRTVLETLKTKHPEQRQPANEAPEEHADDGEMRESVPLLVGDDDVQITAGALSGAAGPSGVDAVHLQHWLLHFKLSSERLRHEAALWTEWLANEHLPWAAFRAFQASRLIALDKQPGVRPVGVGKSFRRLFAKIVLRLTRHEATAACGNTNLCSGLKAGIEGAVHTAAERWEDACAQHPGVTTHEEHWLAEAMDGVWEGPMQTPGVAPVNLQLDAKMGSGN